MSFGVDFSFARPGGAALRAAGVTFVVRYLNYPGAGGKGLTAAEIADYHAHGISIVLNFESAANRALGGRAAGVYDGLLAKAALAALGVPSDRPVYFSVDFDETPAQQPVVDAYFDGAASVLGRPRTGGYGSFNCLWRLRHDGKIVWLWQTYAWSAGQLFGGTNLYQYQNGQSINGSVDFDRSITADFGQWEANMAQVPVTSAVPAHMTVAKGTTFYGTDGVTKLLVYEGPDLVNFYSPYAAGSFRAAMVTPHQGGPSQIALVVPVPGTVVTWGELTAADVAAAKTAGYQAGVADGTAQAQAAEAAAITAASEAAVAQEQARIRSLLGL